jgi:hypothetical protein
MRKLAGECPVTDCHYEDCGCVCMIFLMVQSIYSALQVGCPCVKLKWKLVVLEISIVAAWQPTCKAYKIPICIIIRKPGYTAWNMCCVVIIICCLPACFCVGNRDGDVQEMLNVLSPDYWPG